MNKRDVTFDLMKGLGILLMMVCHMPDIPKGVHQFVYSFHMPLFFIISGYFTKKRDRIDENYVSDLLKKLVLPFIIVQFALVLWGGVMSIAKHDMNFLYRYFCEFVWTSALPWHTNYGDIYTGAVWFLLAMFWAKLFFSYLLSKSKHYFLICFIISTIVNVTCIYCRQILYLPTFIIQGAGAVQLLAVGYWFKQNELPGWTVFVGAIAWLLAMVFGGIDLYGCYYKLYPVSIFGAIGGVYVLYLLSRNVVNMLKNICPPPVVKIC